MHAHPALYGRNYFNRYEVSKDVGDEEDSKDNEMEFGEIMMDVQKLRDAARIYLRPEIRTEIKLDSECFGRNYFSRYSAPNVENKCYADERVGVLADAAVLKKAATSYMHPEIGIKKTDGEMFGRNYFNRYSAPETEEHQFANERAEILTEAAALKKSAITFMHPEFGVTSTDGQMFGRNYFERPSAPNVESIDEADERAIVLADAAALKKSAIAYMHPEVGVTSTDGEIFGRNYFHRYSAPETEWVEFADERAEILAEAAALKTSAMAYMHPELGVSVEDSTVFGRNYFSRYSAYPIESLNKANERALVLAEAAALKKSAIDYMHPEIGVKCTGGAVFGRNYFNRFSACLEGAKCPKVSGAPSQDLTAICNLGKAIKGMNLPSTASSSKNLSERVREAPKSASVVQLFGLSDDLI